MTTKLFSIFPQRQRYQFQSLELPEAKYVFIGLALFLIAMVLRSWDNFATPGLYAEDTAHYFNYYYGNTREIADIFRQPNGYFNIFNNLMAFLIAKADVKSHAMLYQLTGIVLCFCTVAAFSFSGLLKNRYTLLAAPLLLGFSGLNHLYYYISLTFQMYVVVLLLLTLCLWRQPLTGLTGFFTFLLMVFLVWSGPYSVLVVPFTLIYALFFKDKNWQLLGLIFAAVIYTLSLSAKSGLMLENLFSLKILATWGKALFWVFYMGFETKVNPERLTLIGITFFMVLVLLRKDTYYLKTALVLLAIIVASFAPFFLSKKYLLYQTFYPCHFMIAQFFWVALILFTGDRLLATSPRVANFTGPLFLLLCLVFIVVDNQAHPDKRKVPIHTNIKPFLQAVSDAEKSKPADRKELIIVKTLGKSAFMAQTIVGDHSAPESKTSTIWIE